MIDFIKPITTVKRRVDWSGMVYLLTGSLSLILILDCMTSNLLVLELFHSIKPKAVLLWKLKIAWCSELVKSRVPSIWFVWKIWAFLVTRGQKLGARGHRALLEHSPVNFYIYNRGQNCWDIVFKWCNVGEQNNPCPSPRSPLIHSKLSCLLFSTRLDYQPLFGKIE